MAIYVYRRQRSDDIWELSWLCLWLDRFGRILVVFVHEVDKLLKINESSKTV